MSQVYNLLFLLRRFSLQFITLFLKRLIFGHHPVDAVEHMLLPNLIGPPVLLQKGYSIRRRLRMDNRWRDLDQREAHKGCDYKSRHHSCIPSIEESAVFFINVPPN